MQDSTSHPSLPLLGVSLVQFLPLLVPLGSLSPCCCQCRCGYGFHCGRRWHHWAHSAAAGIIWLSAPMAWWWVGKQYPALATLLPSFPRPLAPGQLGSLSPGRGPRPLPSTATAVGGGGCPSSGHRSAAALLLHRVGVGGNQRPHLCSCQGDPWG